MYLFIYFFFASFFVVCFWIFFFVFLLKCVNKLTKKIKSMNLIETHTRAKQEPFDFMSVWVADGKKKKSCILVPYNFAILKLKWRLRFWNNHAVSNYPGHLVKKTGVRTLTVLHKHDNRESPFHRQTRKSWPWQKALVPTVSFNTQFYGRRDTQSWGLYFFTPATTATWLYIGVWPHSMK